MSFRSWMTSCALCGGWPVNDQTIFCQTCWSQFERWVTQSHGELILQWQMRIHYGFSWREGEGSLKRDFLHAMKGRSCSNTWRRIAEIWARVKVERIKEIRFANRHWLAVPGRDAQMKDDHAHRWCEALRSIFGGESRAPLTRKTLDSQRLKGLQERRCIEFELNLDLLVDENSWLIADDVVTSGATVLALNKALNSPPETHVFALSHRIRTTGSNQVDLSVPH